MFFKAAIILLLSCYHPLHLGVLHIDMQKDKAHINIRLFTDDLENGIKQETGKSIKIHHTDSVSLKFANEYVNKYFNLSQNQINKQLQLIKIRKDQDVTEFDYTATIDTQQPLQICCEIFLELFRDQTNLLIINKKQEEDGHRLNHNQRCINVEN